MGGVQTTDSRSTKYGRYRRKRCVKCEYRWSTVEMPVNDITSMRQMMESATIIEEASKRMAVLRTGLSKHGVKALMRRLGPNERHDGDVLGISSEESA